MNGPSPIGRRGRARKPETPMETPLKIAMASVLALATAAPAFGLPGPN